MKGEYGCQYAFKGTGWGMRRINSRRMRSKTSIGIDLVFSVEPKRYH